MPKEADQGCITGDAASVLDDGGVPLPDGLK
jgi:hypothetical protein